MYITFDRVGQGFWVYGMQGSSKSGIRYIYAEIWVLSISFALLTTNFGHNVLWRDRFGCIRNQQELIARVSKYWGATALFRSRLPALSLQSDAPALGFRPVIFWASKTKGGGEDSPPSITPRYKSYDRSILHSLQFWVYLGKLWIFSGILWVYWYTTTPPPPLADPDLNISKIQPWYNLTSQK